MGENVMMLPIVRLSYYKAISPRKLKVLELLFKSAVGGEFRRF